MNSTKILLASTIVLAVILAGTLGILYIVLGTEPSVVTASPTITSSSVPLQGTGVGTTPTYPIQLSENVLSVSGYGVVSVTPDRAKIQMTVSTQASNAQDAAAKNADIFTKFVQALQQAGVSKDNVETTQYNINPVYYYPPQGGQPVLTGYRAAQSFTVTVLSQDVNQLGKNAGQVIDLSVGAGVNQVSSIYFTVSNDAYQILQNQALIAALKDANGQAKAIADTLGLRIVTVKSVSYGSYYPQPVKPLSTGASAAPATTEVVPSSLQISASVQVVYLIAQA